MQALSSTLTQIFHKAFFALTLVCLLSLIWLGAPHQPSYAATKPTMTQTQSQQNLEAREAAYEEAKEIADDPKMGVEKEYEKEIEAYRQENGEGGIIEGAKELVEKVTGQ